MARVRSKSKDAEVRAKPLTKSGVVKKTPVKPTAKRGRTTSTPPPPPPPTTTRSSRSQSRTRRPSYQIQEAQFSDNKSKSVSKDDDQLVPLDKNISSDELVQTAVPATKLPRIYWITNYRELSPPWIGCSDFVPPVYVEYLMRSKKRLALGKKWEEGKNDKITNMEGALHTFVTSIELAWLHGERGYNKGHTFTPYPHSGKFRSGRQVLVSNMIHQDFENGTVMMVLSALTTEETTLGRDFNVPSTKEKQSRNIRNEYDDALRRLMVHHLTLDGQLPSIEEGSATAMSRVQAKAFLTNKVLKVACTNVLEQVKNKLFWLRNATLKSKTDRPLLSLEILVATAFHQFRNEMDTLEKVCPQGYIYTFSAPKIFIGAFSPDDGLMACIYAAGLKHYIQTTKLKNMRVFQVPDIPGEWVSWMKMAMSEVAGVQIMTRPELYSNKKTPLDSYSPPSAGTMLVLHNCSDAFGQNIRYESGVGSLDAIIGRFTSAAGSLINSRENLVSRVAVFGE